MTERQMIGYGLMLLIAITLAAFLWWKSHNTFDKKYGRQRKRDQQQYLAALEKQTAEDALLSQARETSGPEGPGKIL